MTVRSGCRDDQQKYMRGIYNLPRGDAWARSHTLHKGLQFIHTPILYFNLNVATLIPAEKCYLIGHALLGLQ